MKRKHRLWAIILLMFLVLGSIMTGCGKSDSARDSASTSNSADMAVPMGSTEEAKMDQGSSSPQESPDYNGQTSNPDSNPLPSTVQKRMVIYNASITLTIKDYGTVSSQIVKDVESKGGYVVESNVYNAEGNGANGKIVVKIPQTQFNAFMDRLEQLSIGVEDKVITGNDVTEEYVDLESRLKSKLAVESRLLSFMEKATKTEDLLKISSDLANVQEEIERLRGRMNYLKNNTDFSTVTISLIENIVKIPNLSEKSELNTWANAKKLFMETINFIVSVASRLLILLIGLSPVLVTLAVIGGAIYIIRKKKGKDQSL